MELKEWKLVKTSELITADWNYKTDDDELELKLEENIRRNGVIVNLIIRPVEHGFEVVNGNHRLKVIRKLGIKEVMCCNVGQVTIAQAERIAVETNELNFKSDEFKLASVLKDILTETTIEDLTKTIPQSPKDVDAMLKLIGYEPPTSKDNADAQNGSQSEDFRTLVYRLPDSVADMLEDQIQRFRKALEAEDDSIVQPIEAMCRCLSDVPDRELI